MFSSLFPRKQRQIAKDVNVFKRRADVHNAGDFLVEPFKNYPKFTPDWTIVLGAGALSGLVAVQVAKYMREGKLGRRVVFVGGNEPEKALFAEGILEQLEEAGIERPSPGETESHYMHRLCGNALRESNEKLKKGADENDLVRRAEKADLVSAPEDGTAKMEEKVALAKKIGWEKSDVTVGIVCLPHQAYRAMSTVRALLGNETPVEENKGKPLGIALMPVWPEEIGIGPKNYQWNKRAAYSLLAEKDKVLTAPSMKGALASVFASAGAIIVPENERRIAAHYARIQAQTPLHEKKFGKQAREKDGKPLFGAAAKLLLRARKGEEKCVPLPMKRKPFLPVILNG